MVLGDITFSTKSNLLGNIDGKHYVLSMEQPHYKKLQLCAGRRRSRDREIKGTEHHAGSRCATYDSIILRFI